MKASTLTEGEIADVQDSCKHLRIPQANGNHDEAATATKVYYKK